MSTNKTPDKDALNIESELLKKFEGLTNAKKIKKLATRLLSEADNEIAKMVCMDIIKAKDPCEKLKRSISLINDASVLVEEFIEQGAHGMIIIGSDTYTVEVKTMSKWLDQKDKWTEEDEVDIQYKAAEDWLRAYNQKKFLGKVVLFSQFGFSGVPRLIEVTLG